MAKYRFVFIMARVFLECFISHGSLPRSSDIRTISAASIATSLPISPIAIPRVATAIEGASLTPSPTIATYLKSLTISSTFLTLSSGRREALKSSRPTAAATWRAVPSLSPVNITIFFTPTSLRDFITDTVSDFILSDIEIRPHTSFSLPITTTEWLSFSISSIFLFTEESSKNFSIRL